MLFKKRNPQLAGQISCGEIPFQINNILVFYIFVRKKIFHQIMKWVSYGIISLYFFFYYQANGLDCGCGQCDDDSDGDGLQNDQDNCPLIWNVNQEGYLENFKNHRFNYLLFL